VAINHVEFHAPVPDRDHRCAIIPVEHFEPDEERSASEVIDKERIPLIGIVGVIPKVVHALIGISLACEDRVGTFSSQLCDDVSVLVVIPAELYHGIGDLA